MSRSTLALLATCCHLMGPFVAPVQAGPTVVPTAEGQIGETPVFGDKVLGARFESIRGRAGDIVFASMSTPLIIGGAPPVTNFLTDTIHNTSDPTLLDTQNGTYDAVVPIVPRPARSRNAANDGDFVAFSFAVDGAMPQTMTVRIATYDETGTSIINVPVITDVPTFPDAALNQTGVAVDNQGRATVVYTELPAGIASVKAQRVDAVTGLPIGGQIGVSGPGHAYSDVALLDPAGNRLIIPYSSGSDIVGTIVDLSGPTPVVLPEFPISTTPALFASFNTAVAANPNTGTGMVVWEDLSAQAGDPVNIRGRRFDANGNPVGGDFLVNTTTAEAQGQPAVAVDPLTSAVAVAWAGDSAIVGDELDVFLQVYDADGQPVGPETRVNTTTAEVQDRPAVRFLPEPDSQGRPQVTVVWRDVAQADGSQPNGTGQKYKCFSIEGLGDPTTIFADGFESGDTSSWSSTQP